MLQKVVCVGVICTHTCMCTRIHIQMHIQMRLGIRLDMPVLPNDLNNFRRLDNYTPGVQRVGGMSRKAFKLLTDCYIAAYCYDLAYLPYYLATS